MGFTAEFPNMTATIHDVRGLGRAGVKAQQRSLEAGGEVLAEAVRQHLSATQYTLADLARMDHPYAKRHGSIGVHPSRPFVVHKRSQRMRNAVTNEQKFAPGGSGGGGNYVQRVGIDYGRQPYFRYVIQGTRVMLPRDTVYLTSQLDSVRKGMMQAVIKVLGAELRTQATVRF